jgi:hypothetical protein
MSKQHRTALIVFILTMAAIILVTVVRDGTSW